MIIDFITLNATNIMLCTILLNIFYLDNKKLYTILIIDILINGVPFITIFIVLLYFFNRFIFKYINANFITRYFLIIFYYFLFNIMLYSVFNRFNLYIINLLMDNLVYNALYYFVGLKYLDDKYNLVGE